MAHGDLLRTYQATDKNGKTIGRAKVLEVTLAADTSTVELVAAETGESPLIVGGFLNADAAAELTLQDDSGTPNQLAGVIVIGAADSQVLFDQGDFIGAGAGRAIDVARSASVGLKGEIHVVYRG